MKKTCPNCGALALVHTFVCVCMCCHHTLFAPPSLLFTLLRVCFFFTAGRREQRNTSRSGASAAHCNSNSGRSAFADATAAAAAMPDEAAADYAQVKRPSKPLSATEPAAAEGQQQARRGSDKSMSSMGQIEASTMSQIQSPRTRRDQVLLKVRRQRVAMWLQSRLH